MTITFEHEKYKIRQVPNSKKVILYHRFRNTQRYLPVKEETAEPNLSSDELYRKGKSMVGIFEKEVLKT